MKEFTSSSAGPLSRQIQQQTWHPWEATMPVTWIGIGLFISQKITVFFLAQNNRLGPVVKTTAVI